MELTVIFESAHDASEEAMLELLRRFAPLLRKYAALLQSCEDAYEELRCECIRLVKQTDWKALRHACAGVYVRYLAVAIRRKYLAMAMRASAKKEINFSALSEQQVFAIETTLAAPDTYDALVFQDLRQRLTENEFAVLYQTCVQGISAAQLAACLGKSRQSVHQLRQRALRKLKPAR